MDWPLRPRKSYRGIGTARHSGLPADPGSGPIGQGDDGFTSGGTTSTAGFQRLDAASALSATQSRLTTALLAAQRSPTPSLSQWRTELRSPDSERAGLASFVGARGEWNGPDQWLATTGLSTPLGLIASPLHRVVRAAPPTWPGQCLLRLPLRPDYARSGCYQRHKTSCGQKRPRTKLLQQR